MSTSEEDYSPFDEEKKNRMVWIVPSVLLHVIFLIVWLSLPEEPPRKPSTRKLIINSQQAEQLQQHVEDANLLVLHSKVSELQDIKQAMAKIRDNKMNQLRSFEQEMIEVAPRDARDLFHQFMSAQMLIIQNYQELLETINQSESRSIPLADLIEEKNLEALMPSLFEIDDLHTLAHQKLTAVQEQSDISFALVNTGEVQLDWIENPAVMHELAELKQAMSGAREAKNKVFSNVKSAYGGKPEQALNRLTEVPDDFIQTLKDYEQHLLDGQAELEKKQTELSGKIADSENKVLELETQIKSAETQLKTMENGKEKNALTQNLKKLRGQLKSAKRKVGDQKKAYGRLKFSPDRKLGNKYKAIHAYMDNLFTKSPQTEWITQALQAQRQVAEASKALLETLAQSNVSPAEVQP
ncbi:hypothetical protein P0Y35_13105 [Kiritimatiellaeota bacterium B1221]|nr:hypothetical protein [Kiritimatiellaeota bacterium B1221]